MKHQKSLWFIFLLIIFAIILFPLNLVSAQSSSTTRIGVFSEESIAPGDALEIPVQVADAQNLFAIDLEMTFDPEVLQAEDADPNTDGIQLGYGGFLDPGLLLYNSVDNEKGVIKFVMTQVNPSEPKSGDGILLVIYFQAVGHGNAELTITNLQIADDAGNELAVEKVESALVVETVAPTRSATSIPVVDPTSMIIIPTMMPTAIPTSTPMPTATPVQPTATNLAPTANNPTSSPAKEQMGVTQQVEASEPASGMNTPQAIDEQQEPDEKTVSQNEAQNTAKTSGFFLLDHWWIIVVAAGLLLTVSFYLFRSQK